MGHLYPHHGSENATEEGAERVQEPEDGQESSRHSTAELKQWTRPRSGQFRSSSRRGRGSRGPAPCWRQLREGEVASLYLGWSLAGTPFSSGWPHTYAHTWMALTGLGGFKKTYASELEITKERHETQRDMWWRAPGGDWEGGSEWLHLDTPTYGHLYESSKRFPYAGEVAVLRLTAALSWPETDATRVHIWKAQVISGCQCSAIPPVTYEYSRDDWVLF